MIEIAPALATVHSGNLQKVLYDKHLIAALARQLVASSAEGHIEMISDFPGEYNTFADVDKVMQYSKDAAADMFTDFVTEFRDAVHAEIQKVNIEVRKVNFTKEFVDDVYAVIT